MSLKLAKKTKSSKSILVCEESKSKKKNIKKQKSLVKLCLNIEKIDQ